MRALSTEHHETEHPLDVMSRDVGQPGDGWLASDGGVGAVPADLQAAGDVPTIGLVIVEVEPEAPHGAEPLPLRPGLPHLHRHHTPRLRAGATSREGSNPAHRTNYPLLEIALSCGYADQSHLNRKFKKHTGIPPGEYRKRS